MTRILGGILLATALGACASASRGPMGATATSTLRKADGTEIGTVRLEQTASGVRMTGNLTGLSAGAHGIHFHTVGRCDGPDFSSAGGHFNPRTMQHGLANPQGPHAGDLPAIGADASGRATVEATSALVTLDGAATGLLDADGTAIVVHAANDDQRTDPSGNSGGRIACGVITRS